MLTGSIVRVQDRISAFDGLRYWLLSLRSRCASPMSSVFGATAALLMVESEVEPLKIRNICFLGAGWQFSYSRVASSIGVASE